MKKTITFLINCTLVLEQKTNSGETMQRDFAKGQTVEVEGVVPLIIEESDWFDIIFPVETGWIASAIHKSTFSINQ